MNIVVYGDSMSWGIIPSTRQRLVFDKRWTGVLQSLLGEKHRVIEECLNGRTTQFEDVNRPARNGLAHIQMVMESHSPVDLVIIMLGINDFQDVVGASAKQSANGLKLLVEKVIKCSPEPMKEPAQVIVVIPPEIVLPKGAMAEKFSGFEKGKGSEAEYLAVLKGLNVHVLQASKYITLSKIDGVHLDQAEHKILAEQLARAVLLINES